MPLADCIRAHTHRQYLTWMAWLDEQWNSPSRTDYYLIQIAYLVGCVMSMFSSRRSTTRFETYKLKFTTPAAKKSAAGRDMAAAASKAGWFGMFGMLGARKLHSKAAEDALARRNAANGPGGRAGSGPASNNTAGG